jgi:hypothetical protein
MECHCLNFGMSARRLSRHIAVSDVNVGDDIGSSIF